MAINLTTTAQAASNGIKVLAHGPAGAGKTTACSTTEAPTVIISAEAGLLSLRHLDIPVIEVANLSDVQEAYVFVQTSADAKDFEWVCLDSISEIAEKVLSYEMAQTKDPRKAYGELQAQMMDLLRAFRDLPRNIYMSCKQIREKDEGTGATLYVPSMPGAKLGQQIPYLFDEVFALRVEKDQEGSVSRWFQTGRDLQYEAKDRSGALDLFEPVNLEHIAKKIHGDITSNAA